MLVRSLRLTSRPLVSLFSVVVALTSLACSGESNPDGDEGDDSGGTTTGGTTTGGTTTGGSGGSGTGGASGSGGRPAYCDAAFTPTDPTAIIDDLEDGDSLVKVTGDRNGGWWISSDGTGTIQPPSDAAPLPETIPGKRCDSTLGMRITGQGFTTWGAVMLLSFRYTTQQETIDVSTFSGVMFWARTGETHNSPIRVQFQDVNTRPESGICNPEPGSADECYNGWGTELAPISTEWRLYKLDFSRMAQRDYGYRAEAFETTAVYNIEWVVSQNTVFDLWIDDVSFYE